VVRGWRSFVTAPVANARVRVRLGGPGGAEHEVVSDRSGYVDAVVPHDLPPGWHELSLQVEDRDPVPARVRVVPAAPALGLVSDIDDTVMVTSLPRPLIAAWNTFVVHEHARRAVPGMAAMYRRVLAEHGDGPVVYLSTGAWNVAPTLARFLERHGYPPGPLLLTDWGPTNSGWFRSGREHKRAALERLTEELPQVRWLLVGDDGQHDPQLYTGMARHRRERVAAIAIRRLSPTEQLLAHGTPAPVSGTEDAGVPVVAGPDGSALEPRVLAVLAGTP
jgi:phosphatidate phosphatase APP1